MPDRNASGPPGLETSLQAIAGGRLILELWPRRGSSLLFYPGTMIEPGHYRLFLNELSLAGFSVCGLHLPGHGANREKVSTFKDFIQLGQLAVEWLQNKFQEAAVICGHSQGGILAMAHAASFSSAAACFAISAALPELEKSIAITRFGPLAPWRKQILSALGKAACALPKLPVPLLFYLSGRRILAGRQKPVLLGKGKSGIAYPLKFLYSLFSAKISTPLAIPLWLYSARDDSLFPPELIIETFESARPSAGGIVWLQSGGHMNIFNPLLAAYTAKSCAAKAASLGLSLQAGQA